MTATRPLSLTAVGLPFAMNLSSPIKQIPRVGPYYQKKLNQMGIKTIGNLLWHFPARYEDFSNIQPINKIKVGEQICVCGRIVEIKSQRTWKKKMALTEALMEDKSGAVRAVWFNQPFISRNLKKSDNVCLTGKVSWGKQGPFLSSPGYEKTSAQEIERLSDKKQLTHTGRLIPVYPETRGVSSKWLRYVIKPLLTSFKDKIPETLPQEIMAKENLLPLSQAVWQIHFPDSMNLAQKAKQRFSFENLFLIALTVLRERLKLNQQNSPAISMQVEIMREFVEGLPFKLTDAQRKCVWQILKDIEKPMPMSRLLEGDVGSGKTVVAVMAMLNTVKAGFQAALMTPTEILAKQHFKETAKLLKDFKIRIALLTSKQDKIISQKLGYQTKTGFKPEILEISRNRIIEKAKNNEIDLLIGTHALIQDKVKFSNLGLVIIDEQHRFGIEQRAKLVTRETDAKKFIPHLLSMTATPIPRSLALTIYGDLDLSILDQMPKGRKKITTKVVPPSQRNDVYDFIRERVKRNEQVFVICPRIESGNIETEEQKINVSNFNDRQNLKQNDILSRRQAAGVSCQWIKEKDILLRAVQPRPKGRGILRPGDKSILSWTEAKAVKEEYEKLSKEIFPDLKIEMLHGKMKTKEKEKIMQNFRDNKFDILVSTSVVEVGVDIPNATVMVIEGAERFGLAQLHQFRGRVGRSDIQAHCFLLTESSAKKTHQRLKAIKEAKSGFELAEKDLAIRGPGSLFGAKQWGLPDFAMEGLRNLPLVEKTRQLAKEILQDCPTLKKYPLLLARVGQFKKQIHLE